MNPAACYSPICLIEVCLVWGRWAAPDEKPKILETETSKRSMLGIAIVNAVIFGRCLNRRISSIAQGGARQL